MSHRPAVFVACCLVCVHAGCVNGTNTRLPALAYGDLEAERYSYQVHDPLPDRDSGPATMGRPRGYVQQRKEPRRTLEPRTMQGLPPGGYPATAPVPGSEYPNVVPY